MSGTEEEQAAAVIAALNAAGAFAFDVDEMPGKLPAQFTQVTISQRFGGNPRQTTRSGVTGWRITTRQVGKSVSNARELRKRTHQALEQAVLAVAGETSTPVAFETADPIGADDGWYSGLETWTYVI